MNDTAMPNYILDQHLEEQVAEKWKLLNIYEKLMDRTEAERFTLREMPIAVDSLDFDNLAARIHQDIFLKNNLQQNIHVDYKPHWDYCAPSIQQQVLNTEPKESHDVLAFRNQYKQHFQTAIVTRKQELEALGMFADWKNSTKNLCNRNESKILTSFNKLRAQKQIETDQKLEVWCYNRNTVVDEDDFEIRPTEVLSGYVKFPMKVGFEEFGSSMSIVVSIQEIWQVVATVAIGIRTDQRYFIAKLGKETVITAESDILEDKLQLIRPIDSEQVAECICMHPILNSDIPIVQLSDANNWDGISHIAPGHDPDHYIIAKTKALPISSVIDNTGYLNEATNMFYGLKIAEAEKIIESELAKRNYLVQTSKSVVQLPYCNMSKRSVIYRLVHKWSLAIDRSVVTKLVNCDQNWEGHPTEETLWIKEMILQTPPPSISSHRNGSIPFPIFQCEKCNTQLSDTKTLKAIRELISRRGNDIWFKLEAEDLLPMETICTSCGSRKFHKETTFLSEKFAVIINEINNSDVGKNYPKSINHYFYCSENFPKWFAQLNLVSIALHKTIPYRRVEMTKINKNFAQLGVDEEIVGRYPADVVRIFAIAESHNGNSVNQQFQACQKDYWYVSETLQQILFIISSLNSKQDLQTLRNFHESDNQVLERTNTWLSEIDFAYVRKDFGLVWCLVKEFSQMYLRENYLAQLEDLIAKNNSSLVSGFTRSLHYQILIAYLQRIAPITPFLTEYTYTKLIDQINPIEAPQLSIFLLDWVSRIPEN